MTIEKPIDFAHVWLINATEEPIDIYVNYAAEPTIANLKPCAVGPEFQVKGKDDTPYGMYTFSARAGDHPTADVLAAASIEFSEGRSFTAVLHYMPGLSHRFSVYENDFTPSDAPRLTVRHNARPPELRWRISPKDEKPEIPVDEREGSLLNGQWQVATNVVQNDYKLEVLLDGRVVAEHPDYEIEHEKDRTAYIVGDPSRSQGRESPQHYIFHQEFKLPRGTPPEAEVTPPAEPYSTLDTNQPIEFDCPAVEAIQTNQAAAVVSAVDPDGVITDIAIAGIYPDLGGVAIADNGVNPSPGIGRPASAIIEILDTVPPGEYEITVVTNLKSFGQRAVCAVLLTVYPVTLDRIRTLIDNYVQLGAIEVGLAAQLLEHLARAERNLLAGDDEEGCHDLKEAAALVASAKDKGIDVPAAEHLEREIKALRGNLGCG